MKYKGKEIHELSCEESQEAVKDLVRKYNKALIELIAIKTGTVNIAPEKSYEDWTVKKIRTLKEAQEHAGKTLVELGYRQSV